MFLSISVGTGIVLKKINPSIPLRIHVYSNDSRDFFKTMTSTIISWPCIYREGGFRRSLFTGQHYIDEHVCVCVCVCVGISPSLSQDIYIDVSGNHCIGSSDTITSYMYI